MKLQKETKPHGKWYGDACGTAFALELIGERWSLLIIRELMLGGRRFSDLRASLPGISAKVLTERMASMEEMGVLARRKLPPPAAVQIYELTEWGYLAEPAIQELGRWAARSPEHNPQLPLSPVSLMLSMRTMLVPGAMGDASGTIGIGVGGDEFLADLQGGQLPVRRGPAAEGDAVFRMTAPLPMLRMIYGHQPLEDVEASSDLTVTGNRDLARRFIQLFALPPKVGQQRE
ncbi:transcriptional regulator [Altererythrobacter xixiisoli]|uniref:Transcriptional regulator n=1 Tax=Croceibacterium xixiisoli TaxID=1476466 RepID=A0A6I4TW41_9SPHN|nr:helix-turn-helix domain-containing protein [Croceibacterium xixiisoli]MXO99341.1 transcriptional regulator [Croceibacterium xixiisoli]